MQRKQGQLSTEWSHLLSGEIKSVASGLVQALMHMQGLVMQD